MTTLRSSPSFKRNDSGNPGRGTTIHVSVGFSRIEPAKSLHGPENGKIEHGDPVPFPTQTKAAEVQDVPGVVSSPTFRGSDTAESILVPSPEQQRATFDRIAATPRPTAVEIREHLQVLEQAAQWLGGESQTWGSDWKCGAAGYDGKGHAADLRAAGDMIDRLAVEVLVLERDRDELRGQLDTIAANAKQVDLSDLASLVARSRRVAEGMLEFDASSMRKAEGRLILELVAALNDQARRLVDLDRNFAAMVAGLSWVQDAFQAGDIPPELHAWGKPSAEVARLWIAHLRAELKAEADTKSLMQDSLDHLRAERRERQRKTRCRVVTSPRFYGEAEREAARCAVSLVKRPPNSGVWDMQGAIVDAVATALGMRRAEG